MDRFLVEKRKGKMKYGFIGMNYFAAKSHNIPFHHKHKNIIEIWITSKPVMKTTLKHEKIEWELMKKGMNYYKAHQLALKYEESPLSLNNILKKITHDTYTYL